jgi:hypothetical protein
MEFHGDFSLVKVLVDRISSPSILQEDRNSGRKLVGINR